MENHRVGLTTTVVCNVSNYTHYTQKKLRYFGHIMRKEDENLEKCIITRMVEGTRGRGSLGVVR